MEREEGKKSNRGKEGKREKNQKTKKPKKGSTLEEAWAASGIWESARERLKTMLVIAPGLAAGLSVKRIPGSNSRGHRCIAALHLTGTHSLKRGPKKSSGGVGSQSPTPGDSTAS